MKPEEYRKAGVRKYWIVDHDKQIVAVRYLQTDAEADIYSFKDKIKVELFEDFVIDFAEITNDLTY